MTTKRPPKDHTKKQDRMSTIFKGKGGGGILIIPKYADRVHARKNSGFQDQGIFSSIFRMPRDFLTHRRVV